MKDLWIFLNGKKTSIGVFLLIIHGTPHMENLIGVEALDIIYYFGSVLGATGVIHRVIKSRNTASK